MTHKLMKDGVELLDRLIEEAIECKFNVQFGPARIRDLEGRRVTIGDEQRKGSILFFDFWPPETVQANWSDLIEWTQKRP